MPRRRRGAAAPPGSAAPAGAPGPPTLWRHRDFRLLWGGETVSELGSQVTTLAMPLVAVTVLHATTLEVGLLTAASTAAFLVIGLPAGAVVDRIRRRWVLVTTDVARALTLASLPVAYALGALTMAQLYVVTLVHGVLTVFFDVAYQSYLPALVGRDHLVEGNAKLGASSAVAQVAGPSMAGGLVQAVGGPYAIVTDAASFLVSAAAVTAIRTPDVRPEPAGARRRIRTDIAEGLRFVLGNRLLWSIAGCTATANFFGGVSLAVAIVFLVRSLHQRPGVIGLLFAAGSVGGVLGAVVAARVAKRIGGARAIVVAAVVSSAGDYLLPLTGRGTLLSLWAGGEFLASIGAVTYNVNQVSFRQALCPERLLGRMNATMRFIVWGVLPLGGIVGGLLGRSIGLRPTLWVAAAGSSLAVVWLLISPLRRLRDMPAAPVDEHPGDLAEEMTGPVPTPDPSRLPGS